MQDGQDLSQLPLQQLLQNEDLVLEEILATQNIQVKIKLNMKVFVQHCIAHPAFTERFINIGLKCPMHQSNNQPMKKLTFVAADVLTCDHQMLAELFILPSITSNSESTTANQEQIQEEIDTDDVHTAMVPPQKKYMFLLSLFDYLNSSELDQNCVNYITKTLATLVRKKISDYLQFFVENPQFLNRFVQISYYPSVAHLLAKMLTDDDDGLTDKAFSVKKRIIPLLIEKLHKDIGKAQTLDIFEGVENILNSTRYADNEQRTALQKMSDVMVSQQQLTFFLTSAFTALESQQKTQQQFITLQNSVTYLTLIITRLNMDEQHDYTYNKEPQQFNPTLNYQTDSTFLQFCKIITKMQRIWEFKDIVGPLFGITPIKAMQPLVLMTRNSRFSQFYSRIETTERSFAFQALLRSLCTVQLKGVLLQSTATLLEKMLVQEEIIAQTQAEILCPDDLYLSISQYTGAIGGSISVLLEQTRNQRNRNQKGIYFRKILLLLDNYFQHKAVIKRYPDTSKLQKLFPAFTSSNNSLYSEKTIVLDHPGGEKSQPVEEFRFIEKNRILLRVGSPQSEATYPEMKAESGNVENTEVREEKEGRHKQIAFKLNSKIQSRKDLVKQNTTDKDQDPQNPTPQSDPINPMSQVISNGQTPSQSQTDKNPPCQQRQLGPKQKLHLEGQSSPQSSPNPKQKQNQDQSPTKQLSPHQCKPKQATGLTFFVRHLMIY